MEHPAEVDVDHRRPPVDVEVGHRPGLADPRVAHQHIEPTELVQRPTGESFEVLPVGDIGGAREGTTTAFSDLPGDLVEPRGAAAPALLAEHEPLDALARWFDRLVDYARVKRGVIAAVEVGVWRESPRTASARSAMR
ncbi:hypothetical protein GCM10025787_13390 [Saccharopolyspora rosea]